MRQIAVSYYPEGAGHATRMLAIGAALERRGADVAYAGGGPGTAFVRRNGHDVFEPTPVSFIPDYQGGSLGRTLLRSVPRSAGRVADYVGWLRAEEPAALVTDDMFAALAALAVPTPLFVVSHNSPTLYSRLLEREMTRLVDATQRATAELYLDPSLWPTGGWPSRSHRSIPPLAFEADGEGEPPEPIDVLVVPSTFSEGFDVLADRLRDSGREVTLVGDESWTPLPSLFPYIEAATCVVCSGYSTIMEAAVAGTHCVVYPFTDEQVGVAARLAETAVTGFDTVSSPAEAVEAVDRAGSAPDFPNGAARAADAVIDRLDRLDGP